MCDRCKLLTLRFPDQRIARLPGVQYRRERLSQSLALAVERNRRKGQVDIAGNQGAIRAQGKPAAVTERGQVCQQGQIERVVSDLRADGLSALPNRQRRIGKDGHACPITMI